MRDLTYSESIHIEATPAAVFAAVSDIARMGEWSPVCKECRWDEGDGPRVGAFFTGRNVTPERTWETRCEVVTAETNRSFGWSVEGGAVFWTYDFAEVDGGTNLTETWHFPVAGQELFQKLHGDEAAAEIESRRKAAHEGIPATLAAVKRALKA